MKIPVIIPAYNEAERIGATLRGLDASMVEPFVVVNGFDGLQETVDEAAKYTPNVFVNEVQGKFPAMQMALRKVFSYDNEAFHRPIIMTDADARPLRPTKWAEVLREATDGEVPRTAAGPVYFNDAGFMASSLRNARRLVYVHQLKARSSYDGAIGSNMAINFAGHQNIIDEVLDLPHIWYGEDQYLLRVVSENDNARHTQLTSFSGAVVASSRFVLPFSERFKLSREERYTKTKESYLARRAPGATHYFDHHTVRLVEFEEN